MGGMVGEVQTLEQCKQSSPQSQPQAFTTLLRQGSIEKHLDYNTASNLGKRKDNLGKRKDNQ